MATSNPQMYVMLRKPAAVLCKRFQFGCKRLQILTTHMHSSKKKSSIGLIISQRVEPCSTER